jgi:hypothetical protein
MLLVEMSCICISMKKITSKDSQQLVKPLNDMEFLNGIHEELKFLNRLVKMQENRTKYVHSVKGAHRVRKS